jgi:hypothetical protein
MNANSNEGQNKALYEYLESGNIINFLQARDMGVSNLNARIEQIRKLYPVYSRFIRISTMMCEEYRLIPFE